MTPSPALEYAARRKGVRVLHLERTGRIAVLRLEHGKVNEMDAELLRAIEGQLEEIERSDAAALVIIGTGRIFSGGANLVAVGDASDEQIRDGVSALGTTFTALFDFPRPVVAAVNGHAIAGGCVLACACDHRVVARGALIGLAELRVGIPFPTAALEVVRFAVTHRYLQQLVYFGESYQDEEAIARGLADEVADPEEVLARSIAVAEQLATIPPSSFAHTKRALRRPIRERIERVAPGDDPIAADIWTSEEGRGAIARFLEQTFGSKA